VGVQVAQGVYYSVLDSVNFNPERPHRDLERVRISAAGSLMLGLLVGNTRPILSDAQIFDNTLIIDTVAAFDRESEAFLGLIRDGRLQARILAAPNLSGGVSQRVRLSDAFIAALRRPNFVFSAWPELEQPDIRQAVLGLLIGNADPVKELDSTRLAQRIMAIRELSGSFEAGARDNSLRVAQRPVFSDRLVRLFENLKSNPEAQDAAKWVLEAAAKQPNTVEYRSTWYRLVASMPDSALGSLSRPSLLDGINGIYNEAISRTLSCDPDISFSDGRMVKAAAQAGLDGKWGHRAAGLAQTEAMRDVMNWDVVRNTLPRLDAFVTPQARLTYLINEFSDSIGRERLESHTATWLRVKAPRQILAKLAAVATAEASLSVSTALGDSHLAQAMGGLVGIVTVFGGAPIINRIVAAHQRRMTEREVLRVRRTLTRNSSAWVQQIDEDRV
jgi:hypothetical protein